MTKIFVLVVLIFVVFANADASVVGVEAAKNTRKYLHVRELTNHNDGPEVTRMLRLVGLDNATQIKRTGTGYSWCAAFVYTNYSEVSEHLGIPRLLPKMARVHNIWMYSLANEARYETFTRDDFISGVYRPSPGDIFIMRYGPKGTNWNGHTGIILYLASRDSVETCEGNTNGSGSREGNGVYLKERKYLMLEGIIRVRYGKN